MAKEQITNPKKNETLLHHKLKSEYCTNDCIKLESAIKVNNKSYRIDALDEEKNIIFEVQRAGFGGRFSKKIQNLLDSTKYNIRIIHPILYKQKTSRMKADEKISVSYRNLNSTILHLFEQLVFFKVPYQDKLEFDILLVSEHVTKEFSGYTRRTHRRKYQTAERDLIEIVDNFKIRSKDDFMKILPSDLPDQFTNQDLAHKLTFKKKTRRNHQLPGKITYSLCQLGILERVGKKRNAFLFQVA